MKNSSRTLRITTIATIAASSICALGLAIFPDYLPFKTKQDQTPRNSAAASLTQASNTTTNPASTSTSQTALLQIPFGNAFSSNNDNNTKSASATTQKTASPAFNITLPSLDRTQLTKLQEEDQRQAGKIGMPTREGIVRDVPNNMQRVNLNGLPWQTTTQGGSMASFDISSPDAQAIRVKLEIPTNSQPMFLSFVDKFGHATEPVAWSELSNGTLSSWSPLLDGDRIRVEIFSPNGTPEQALQLSVAQIAHIYKGQQIALNQARLGNDQISGTAGACSYNASCVNNGNPSAAYTNAENAVARISFISGSSSYLCSASLVGKSSSDGYLLTAAHCISDATTASTLSTRWFYQKTGCSNTDDPRLTNIGGGASLVVSDQSKDLTLLKLKLAAPSTVTALSVASNGLTTGTGFIGIHHPSGDYKKVSEGTVSGIANSTFSGISNSIKTYQVGWKTGITAPGSSGSPMLGWDGTQYTVTGALTGGSSSCQRLTGTDMYSVMSDFYPQIASYVTASTTTPSTPSNPTTPSTPSTPSTPTIADGRYTINTDDGKSLGSIPFYFSDNRILPIALLSGTVPSYYTPIKWMQVSNTASTSNTISTAKLAILGYPIIAPNTIGQSVYSPLNANLIKSTDTSTFTIESTGKLTNGKNAYRIRAIFANSATSICLGTAQLTGSDLVSRLIKAAGNNLRANNSIVSVACDSKDVLKISFDTK